MESMEFFQSAKFKAWVIIPKISSALSIVGSSLIIRDVLRKKNRRKKLKATTNRIVTLMSICDVMFSFVGHFLGTWLVPKETGVWLAAGNQATCTFQGFVMTFTMEATTALNAALAVTYVLVVRFGWKEDRLHKCFVSFILLGVPILASLGLSIWPLIDEAFNWGGGWLCATGAYPYLCEFTEEPCVRGTQGPATRLASMIWVQICFLLIFVSTVSLYWTVLGKERATDRYAVEENQRNRKQSKRVAMQGILYAGSFFLTYISLWLSDVLAYATREVPPYGLGTAIAILVPLQGFFNAIVFFRPRLVNKKKRNGQKLTSLPCQSSLACCAFGIINFSKFTKATGTGTSAKNTNCRSGDVPSLANAADKEQFKNEPRKMEEEAPVAVPAATAPGTSAAAASRALRRSSASSGSRMITSHSSSLTPALSSSLSRPASIRPPAEDHSEVLAQSGLGICRIVLIDAGTDTKGSALMEEDEKLPPTDLARPAVGAAIKEP